MWQRLLMIGVLAGPAWAGVAAAQDRAPRIELVGVVPKNSAEQFELAFWESIKDSNQASDYEAYLKQYPKGRFAALAQARLARLRAAQPQAATPKPPPIVHEAAPKPPPPTKTTAPAPAPAATPAHTVAAGTDIKDCPACPTLVSIPGGTYTVGNNTSDPSEKPAHARRSPSGRTRARRRRCATSAGTMRSST